MAPQLHDTNPKEASEAMSTMARLFAVSKQGTAPFDSDNLESDVAGNHALLQGQHRVA